MAKSQHVIELNGQLYDAVTGARVIGDTVTTTAHVPSETPAQPAIASASHMAPLHRPTAQKIVTTSHKPTAAATAERSVTPATKAHKTAQHSQTLMRTTVRKPAAIKVEKRNSAVSQQPSKHSSVHNPSHDVSLQPERVLRSMGIARSQHITKFGKPATGHIKTAAIDVAAAPPKGQHHRSAVQTQQIAVPAPATTAAPREVHAPIAPSDPFEVALQKATSHEQPKAAKASPFSRTAKRLHMRPRTLAITSSALAVLVVAGVLVQHNAPYMAVKVAATRSGVAASVPSYQPAGYSMQRPVDYDPGEVSITYKSNSDDRSFKVIQRASAWTSDALLENVVGQRQHQVYQASGRTIYIYDNNTATWVDGGVWYKVEGNSALGSDQLLKIVNSL